jgi:uracil-DNA glycosylase
MTDPRTTLENFYEEIKDCQRCALAASRTHVVFGNGDPEAEVMLVGEAPGYYEDREGKPFVGAAGQLLDSLLEEIGLRREDVYIANVLKCRPPKNRNPQPDEIESCKPYLYRQIEIVQPRVTCTLGNFATQLLLGKKVGITKVRGNPSRGRIFLFFRCCTRRRPCTRNVSGRPCGRIFATCAPFSIKDCSPPRLKNRCRCSS